MTRPAPRRLVHRFLRDQGRAWSNDAVATTSRSTTQLLSLQGDLPTPSTTPRECPTPTRDALAASWVPLRGPTRYVRTTCTGCRVVSLHPEEQLHLRPMWRPESALGDVPALTPAHLDA